MQRRFCALVLCGLLLAACRTSHGLLSRSGQPTAVWHGQAVWKSAAPDPGVAGDVTLAFYPGGSWHLEFAKPAVPLVSAAQNPEGHWQFVRGGGQRRLSGLGVPPARLLWLHLPAAWQGREPPPPLRFVRGEGTWRLDNPATGEALEGFFNP